MCGVPAAAVLSFDYADRQIWLQDLEGAVDPGDIILCPVHADRRTPPVGWTLTDQRRPERHLFAAVSVA